MVFPAMQGSLRLTLRLVLVCGFASASGSAQPGATDGDWRSYAADTWASKYSPLDQINADNFGDLEIAWRWRTADTHLVVADESGASLVPSQVVFDRVAEQQPDLWLRRPGIGAMSSTPLAVDGVLYLTTNVEQAAAIDGRTGETLWVHDPRTYEDAALPTSRGHRGAAYWEGDGDARIVWGTGAGYLIAVDARTGVPAAEFGDNGRVDLIADLPRSPRGQPFRLPVGSRSAAPLIVGDTIVVGTNHTDFTISREGPPGFIFAHDVRTGKRLWEFHIVPQSADEFGADTWEDESWRYTGNGNAWGNLSADPELGYVYIPTSAVAPDHYGGHRLGDNLFANSIVCLDVETGERVWHYQLVHHEVWDYDSPTAPNLLDITVDGRRVKAVAQVTKQGFVYTFDRVTGEPIWPIEERPAPTDTDLEGEVMSPTQPFPTKPPPFAVQGARIEDLADFTPEIRQMALEAVGEFRLGPLYTPLSLRGTIFRPQAGGGANWSGAAVDPETGVLYVPATNGHSVIRFRDGRSRTDMRYIADRTDPVGGIMRGRSAPWGPFEPVARGSSFLDGGNPTRQPNMPRGLPLWKPPYSAMVAIDMSRGEHLWTTPLGRGARYQDHPLLRDLDLPPLGGDHSRAGSLLTKTLLIHALTSGGTDDGPQLVAYDKATGEPLAAVDLPGRGLGSPMTYLLDGRQYIALTVGGRVPELVAYRLSSESR